MSQQKNFCYIKQIIQLKERLIRNPVRQELMGTAQALNIRHNARIAPQAFIARESTKLIQKMSVIQVKIIKLCKL